MLSEELLGERGTHAHSALDRGGTEVSLSHLSSGRSLVQISFHCKNSTITQQGETREREIGSPFAVADDLLLV